MKTTLKIEGMSCNHCILTIKKYLSKLALKKYEVNIGSAIIEYDEQETKKEMIVKAIEKAGYKVIN